MLFSNICPTFPFNCLFTCSCIVKRLLCAFKFPPRFERKATLVKKCYTIYQTRFIVNKRKRVISILLSHGELLSLFKVNLIRISLLSLKLFSDKYAFPFWYLQSPSLSIFLWVSVTCLLYVLVCLQLLSSSSFCVSVIYFLLFLSVSVFRSSLTVSRSLGPYPFLLSTHTPPASTYPLWWSTQAFLSFENIFLLSPWDCRHLTPKSSPLKANLTEKGST